ncbi:MAG: hypothetical protein H5T41_05090 [Methanomassiliicoccales archaeon]|nr:hypothetical protein [Methanomassiliicoccales archaeon]
MCIKRSTQLAIHSSTFPARPTVSIFLFISAIAHLTLSKFRFNRYVEDLKGHMNSA